MIGPRYWATGITCSWDGQGWAADVNFYDDGFVDQDSTQGQLSTRYARRGPDALARVIDLLKADAERLGIEFRHVSGRPPTLYVPGDGDDDQPLPAGWQALLQEQAARLGWETPYDPVGAGEGDR